MEQLTKTPFQQQQQGVRDSNTTLVLSLPATGVSYHLALSMMHVWGAC